MLMAGQNSPTLVCNLVFLSVYLTVTLEEFLGPFQKNPTTLKSQLFFPLEFSHFSVRPQCLHFGRFLVIWLCCPLSVQWRDGKKLREEGAPRKGWVRALQAHTAAGTWSFPSVFHFLQQSWKPQGNYKCLKALYNWWGLAEWDLRLFCV